MASLLSTNQDTTTVDNDSVHPNSHSNSKTKQTTSPKQTTSHVHSINGVPEPIAPNFDEGTVQMLKAAISKIFKDELPPFQPTLWIRTNQEGAIPATQTAIKKMKTDNGASSNAKGTTITASRNDAIVGLIQLDRMLFPDIQQFDPDLKLKYYSYLVRCFDIDCDSFPSILTIVGEGELLVRWMRNFLHASAIVQQSFTTNSPFHQDVEQDVTTRNLPR